MAHQIYLNKLKNKMRGSREVSAGWPAGANSVWQVENSVHNEVEN
jgi:hypothetical protein